MAKPPSQMHITGYEEDWQEEYKRKLVSAEEAAKAVKSGDRVIVPISYSGIMGAAIVARSGELKNVEIVSAGQLIDPGWFSPGHESLRTTCEIYLGNLARPSHDEKRTDFLPNTVGTLFKSYDDERSERKPIDVLITEVSPPDENGFCSFTGELWHRKRYAKLAKTVIAEVMPIAFRTYGENFIHVSELDYIVEVPHEQLTDEEVQVLFDVMPPETHDRLRSRVPILQQMSRLIRPLLPIISTVPTDFLLILFGVDSPDEATRGIAENLKTIIKNGDTFQIGVGRPSYFMVELGVFDSFEDLGIHSEMAAPGMALLVKRGIATGKYKTLHPGKAVFGAFTGFSFEDYLFASNNPCFELYSADYVANIRTVAAHDNMVAINNGLQVDLTGQLTCETQFGPRMINGPGGQIEFHIGAFLSKRGRAVTLLRSTALGGAVSTIVPQLEKGSLVTIPRHFADYVVTEYGVARLAGKSHRERVEELIAVAHPDHRAELWKEAQKLFYP
jgi:4-hydroxybutyrate CoA-transferase